MAVRKHLRGDGAQSLLEFALIIPMLLILVFGIIDFGMGLRAYISVSSATREGARYAAVGNPGGTFSAGGAGECDGSTSTTAVGRVCKTLNGLTLADVSNVSVTYPTGHLAGQSVNVATTYHYHYITPVHGLVNFLSGGSMPDYLTITSATDMRLE